MMLHHVERLAELFFLRSSLCRKIFSTITTAPSTIMPKSRAPSDRRFAGIFSQIEENRREKQRQRDRRRDDQRASQISEEEEQHDEDEDHALDHVLLDRMGGQLDQVEAVEVRLDLDVRRAGYSR